MSRLGRAGIGESSMAGDGAAEQWIEASEKIAEISARELQCCRPCYLVCINTCQMEAYMRLVCGLVRSID